MSDMTASILVLIGLLALHLVEEVHTGFRSRYPWARFPAARILTGVVVMNGVGHIGIMVYRRDYFPGGVTAPCLDVLSAGF